VLFRSILPALLLVLLLDCRRKPKCFGDLEIEDMYRLQQQVTEGGNPCPQWSRPSVTVDRTSLALDGRALAPRSSLPSGAVRRIDGLFTELKAGRDYWRQLHPSEQFAPVVKLNIDPGLDAFAGISVLASAAYAGFPHMEVESGSAQFSAYWAVPEPPVPAGENRTLVLRIAHATEHGFEWSMDGRSKQQPPAGGIARDLPGLLATLSEECQAREARGEQCAQILEFQLRRGDFLEACVLVQTVMHSPTFSMRRPTIRLVGPGDP
jgi:hypothetical protein